MKVVSILILVFVTLAASAPQATYNTKYDSINVRQILSNERLLDNYIKCLLDLKRCNNEAQELRRVLPEALTTNCAKCTPKQRDSAREVVNFLSTRKPMEWSLLLAKYDPQGIYQSKYAGQFQSEQEVFLKESASTSTAPWRI